MVESSKAKLTLTVDKKTLSKVKEVSKERQIPLSRLVDTYLKFVTDPRVWCFLCGEEFASSKSKVCDNCSYLKCIKCEGCGCKLDKKTSKAVFNMRKVYEHLLGGRLK